MYVVSTYLMLNACNVVQQVRLNSAQCRVHTTSILEKSTVDSNQCNKYKGNCTAQQKGFLCEWL